MTVRPRISVRGHGFQRQECRQDGAMFYGAHLWNCACGVEYGQMSESAARERHREHLLSVRSSCEARP